MIKRLIYPIMGLILLYAFIFPVSAISPQPKIELDEYDIEVSSPEKVYIEGEVSKAYGQWIQLYTDIKGYAINYTAVSNTGKKEEFKILVPKSCLKEGINTFYVRSKAVKDKLSASNFKTVTIKVSNTGKWSQTITASNKTLTVGQEIHIGAKVSSGLPLEYRTDNQNATIDQSGKIIARKVGTTKITISQAGNDTHSSISKTIIITIKDKVLDKKLQTITASNKTIYIGDKVSLNAKASSGLKVAYKSNNPNIVSVDKNGKITGLKKGKCIIEISQAGNTIFKPITKKITITVKDKYTNGKKPIGKLAEGASPKAGIVFNRYRNDWGWVIRANDPKVAQDISKYAKIIAKNNKVGYSQNGGVGPKLYKSLVKKGPSKCSGKASCCPFALVSTKYAFKQNGYNIPIDTNVRTHSVLKHIKKINKKYTSKGKKAPFEIIKMSKSKFSKKNYKKYCYGGDILIKRNQKHTAVLL